MIVVTGGAGFIGSNFVRSWIAVTGEGVVNVDKLTYAGNLDNLGLVRDDALHVFVRADVCDGPALRAVLEAHRPRAVVHLAAETHVDRSIHGPSAFVQTNVVGTHTVLEAVRDYWSTLDAGLRERFRLLHVSTDEVYGSLAEAAPPSTENARYLPNSPYAASKAAADHLVRAYHATFGLPAVITNCSNNYGPYQHPEKLVPLVIINALRGESVPVYGDGGNVRDWLHVEDHCAALRAVLEHGRPGETYNVSAHAERPNLELVAELCDAVDELAGRCGTPRRALISMVPDRPGHDRRYALDATKLRRDLGWRPAQALADGLRSTVAWYIEHQAWVRTVRNEGYAAWVARNYGARRPA